MLKNSATSYGSAARFFHWTIAVLVLIDLGLGVLGKFAPRSADTVSFLQLLYSTHKTIGVTVLVLAVLRVGWAIWQPHPVALHPERRLETFTAEAAHWLLYAAIFVLPLSGWVMHSAEIGYAPIWWPFPQNLPFIPKSEVIADTAATVHFSASIVLAATVAAHISGALKHAVLERDGTLARMWRGQKAGVDAQAGGAHVLPAVCALCVWVLVIGGSVLASSATQNEDATIQRAVPVASGWTVQSGALEITVLQLGSEVSGSFAIWRSTIEYQSETGIGHVSAMIDTTSLAMGSVTDQAKGDEFFQVATFSQASFEGEIARVDGAMHSASGTLTLVGQTVPVTLDFELKITEGIATISGGTVLDRRDFGIGVAYPDESSVGFFVEVLIALTAVEPS